MECKVLEEQDLEMMLDFVDDENTQYNVGDLRNFIGNNGNYGFIVKVDGKIIGFATAYILLKPNSKKVFYLDAIDIMADYRGNGYGAKLMEFIRDYAKSLGCAEMFLVTNKSNTSACKCYEKTGGVSESQDDVVYVYNFEKLV